MNDFADVLAKNSTLLSVMLTAIVFLANWSKDRRFARRQQADQIRIAAALLISKLERWREISLSLFDEIQAGLVETSEIAIRDQGEPTVVAARDYLWKDLSRARATIRRHVMQENIQTSHAQLIAYCPQSRVQFLGVFSNLGEIEERYFGVLQRQTQAAVMELLDNRHRPPSAAIGNALRQAAWDVRERYIAELEPVLAGAFASLNAMIARRDEELIFDRRGLSVGTLAEQ